MKRRDPNVPDDSLFDLAFDQFSRQYQAKRVVEAVRGEQQRLKILDVGGYKGQTAAFFPHDDVMVVDVFDVHEPGYTKADGLALPHSAGSYDFVMCFDVFEHIAQADRVKFLSEMTRVAKTGVLVAAPFNTEYVADAERELNQFYRRLSGNEHRWLREHIDNGLPERTEIEQFFDRQRIDYRVYDSNNILLWTAMQNLIFLADAVKTPELLSKLNRFYNENLPSLGDGHEPSYRRIYLAMKNGQLPKVAETRQVLRPEVVRKWINLAAEAMHDLAYNGAPVRDRVLEIHDLGELLARKDHENAELRRRLDEILNSRSWRLAQKLRAGKNMIVPRRRSR